MSHPSTLLGGAPATLDEAQGDAPEPVFVAPVVGHDDTGAVFGTTRHRACAGDDRQDRIEARLERIEQALARDADGARLETGVAPLLHRFYNALDRLDTHARNDLARAAELEGRLRSAVPEALAASMPAFETALVGRGSLLAERLVSIETRLNALDASIDQLLQRPVPNQKLGEVVAGAQRRLSEDLTRRTAAINRRMEMLAAGMSHPGPLAMQPSSSETSAHLDAIETRLASLADNIEGLVPGLRKAMRSALAELIAGETRDACESAAAAALHGNLSN